MSKTKPSGYEIPLYKCQICYHQTGRYILDCYCVVCEGCYKPTTSENCPYCSKPTNNKKLDTKDEDTFEKVGMMFGKPDVALSRGIEILKFQTNIANRYAEYLEAELKLYKRAIYDLVSSNPRLDKYFSDRIKGFRVPPKSTKEGQRNRSELVGDRKSRKSLDVVEAKKPDVEPKRFEGHEHDKPKEKERERDRERDRNRDRSRDRGDRERDHKAPADRDERRGTTLANSQVGRFFRQDNVTVQPRAQPGKPKADSQGTQNYESFYNWQNRAPANQYYSRGEEDVQYNGHGYVRPRSRSRSGSDMPSSSYIGGKQSGPRDYVVHGFRRRV